MPLYHHLVYLRPTATAGQLTELFRSVCREVLCLGGVVRGVEHQGIRDFAQPIRAKHASSHDAKASRRLWKTRLVVTNYDAAPKVAARVDVVLSMAEIVARHVRLGATDGKAGSRVGVGRAGATAQYLEARRTSPSEASTTAAASSSQA